ncbi:glycerophosphoryl diester phosphodiesterase [Flavobacterium swingsii]|jgi:glycerophosphoryl diester phosphodiesterase|uniref:Glycerophosphoryl diester phosphodiesterase n=1 Tax=Flavobacterium swingsii TaxID=498292 RepID=A0A1I0XSC5_9FLAO|nr:glycerophosphodiester phosphodiesterase family protein [Flavobacterium swingsii]SFB03068.1 glycerophosphoryl diester phosphodiesterase [Flavobacterium swingsii]
MLKIGHRGAKGYVAENTLASFQKAIELKVDGIELDVHLSSDGEIMVIHDETIDRTTSGNGLVKNFTSLELKQFGIPTLTEVLDLMNHHFFVNIELKSNDSVGKVITLIEKQVSEKNWNYNSFMISSFLWTDLEVVSQTNNQIKIGVLTEDSIEKALTFAREIKAFSINPYFKLLNSENVKLMHNEGFQIHTWTVNSPEDITFAKSLHVDAIISDFPDKI